MEQEASGSVTFQTTLLHLQIRKPLEDALEKNPDFLEQLRADIAALELEGGAQGAAAAGGAG